MLLSENFRRRHQAALEAIVDGHEQRHESHHGLARTHVALHQAVHMQAAGGVFANLFEDALLGAGQFKRQMFRVKLVKRLADRLKNQPALLVQTRLPLKGEDQLVQENLFKGQALAGFGQDVWIAGKVHDAEAFVARGPAGLLHDRSGQPVAPLRGPFQEQTLDELAEPACVQSHAAELFRRGIHREQALHRTLLKGIPRFELRMCHVFAPLKVCDAPHGDIVFAGLQRLLDPANALKPYQFHAAVWTNQLCG